MPDKYYRNVETDEVVVVAEGAEDSCKGEMIEDTSNCLYREIGAAEAGVEVEAPEPVVEEPVAEEEVPSEE